MYTFTAQLTKLLKNSSNYQKYYATNLYTTSGYGMPNCTAYALGRVNQLCDLNNLPYNNFSGMYGNGGRWGEPGYIGQDWPRGTIPKLGAIAVFKQEGRNGHVAVVEEIQSNTIITTSNSGWAGSSEVGNEDAPTWWWLQRNLDVNNYGTYIFQYFLYPPYIDDIPTPSTTQKNKFNWVLFNRAKQRNKLTRF